MPKRVNDLSDSDRKVLIDALNMRFKEYLDDDEFELLSESDDEAISIQCRLSREGSKEVYSVEVRAFIKDFKSRPAARDEAIDAVGYVVEQYLESGREVIPPLDWQSLSMGGPDVFIRGDIRNEALLAAADQLLAEDTWSLDPTDS